MPDPVAPDLQGLIQPGANAAGGPIPAPNPVAPPSETMTPAMAPPNVTPNPNAINPTVAPAAPPQAPANVPHARLMNLISALATGMGAAATSIATHGKEGGAAEVIQIQGEEAAQKQRAQEFAQSQKNSALQQQLLTGEINRTNAQNWINMQTAPDEISKSHVTTQAANLELQQKAQEVFDTKGQVPTGWTVDPNTGMVSQSGQSSTVPAANAAPSPNPNATATPNLLPGVNPNAPPTATPAASTGNPAQPSIFQQRQNMILDAAAQELEKNDPLVIGARQVLQNPKSTPQQIRQATLAVQNKAGLSAEVVKNLTAKADLAAKQEAAAAGSSVAKLSTPEALVAPGAQAAIQAKIDDPTTDPNDIPRLRALLPQAAVAQFNAETIKRREARNTQLINQGDPEVAGHLLADRSLTLDELKARQVTPEFITAAVMAAQKYDKTFKAPEATAQSRIAASPANSQFFGNTDSLLVKGGTLDQLATAYGALGNTKIPVINKLDNLRKAAVGNGPLAAAYAAQLGVADDYSKVISGGSGSDTSRQQALDIISRNLSPEGQAAAIAQIRKTVTSQRNGRIGTNPYMADMYPDPSTRQEAAGLAGTQPASQNQTIPKGADPFSKFGGQRHPQ